MDSDLVEGGHRWPIGAGDNDPDSLGLEASVRLRWGVSVTRAAGTWPNLPLQEAGGRAPRPCPLFPVRPEAAAAQMGCWRPQRQRRGYQRSSQMGRPPSALAAPTPRGLQPRPLGAGGRRLGLRSLPPASLPRGPLTPRARPGRPPEGEGEGTSALFVTTESIVCEEPAPAGDRAERRAGAPDGGGARRGERGSREEGGRRGAAGL